jgi:hypothetical protein
MGSAVAGTLPLPVLLLLFVGAGGSCVVAAAAAARAVLAGGGKRNRWSFALCALARQHRRLLAWPAAPLQPFSSSILCDPSDEESSQSKQPRPMESVVSFALPVSLSQDIRTGAQRELEDVVLWLHMVVVATDSDAGCCLDACYLWSRPCYIGDPHNK